MGIVRLDEVVPSLRRVNDEISAASCFRGAGYEAGLIAFHPRASSDPRFITHADKTVLCQVVRGHGRLRTDAADQGLEPGMVCHIPPGTPHDFYADGDQALLIFYTLIEVR
ncbi:MAG: cupin domain-containing protein [Deltaproteobacteria bacterium]|nr:cupin domain-containing protein [Deltaproteobacteria bacterium]MBI3077077.1 cupin domain-containing protein [Deltaproteobacteria bacterium]